MTPASGLRSGFTLLEVLIALGLSVLLIFSIYAAITMSYRYNVAGRGEIAGQQLIRGINHRFQEDLNSVQFAIPQAAPATSTASAAEETTASDSGFSSSLSSSASSTGGATELLPMLSFDGMSEFGLPGMFGLIGRSDMLHICTAIPSRDQGYWSPADRESGAERISDLQVISYGLITLDAVTLAVIEKELDAIRPDQGLGRRTRDFFAESAVDETLSMEDLFAIEVVEITFQYFDGTNWVSDWDSSITGRLPKAVEVTFGIWSAPARELGRRSTNRAGTISHVSHLFFLPSAETVVETTP